ncbi:MAG: 2OG-Fe(II) oxygenase [Pseudomonadota bacterium]
MTVHAPIDWQATKARLNAKGWASLGQLLDNDQRCALRAKYDDDDDYRSTITMRRHGFGDGEYRYFAYPLPEPTAALRAHLYSPLAGIANEWSARLDNDLRYPPTHAEFKAQCQAAGQTRPTPLILKYETGDYNRLHQDLYGDILFPLQVVILLSDPQTDFEGGEFVLTEQRPRAQSRAEVVPLKAGEAVVFCVNERPVVGARGDYRVKMRHGVSEVRRGERFALGLIFHDAA